MNSIKNIRTSIVIIFLLIFSVCNGQINPNDSNEEEILLEGTWVAEGATINDKWVFENNGILKEYTNNAIDITYTWNILSSINSGIKSHYLEIVNVNDISDNYKYEISIINNEELILIYQRPNDMGISKPATYFRQ